MPRALAEHLRGSGAVPPAEVPFAAEPVAAKDVGGAPVVLALSRATVVVAPPNLLDHWGREARKWFGAEAASVVEWGSPRPALALQV